MPEPDPRSSAPALRLAASKAPREGEALPAPLAALLEALAPAGLEPGTAAPVLLQRLGDARTASLLGQGETARAAGRCLAEALAACTGVLARSLAAQPEDAAGRLSTVRACGALRFGQVLLAQGLVAPRRLDGALQAQGANGRRLGEELAAQGLISAREVAEALWLQHKLRAAALALFTAEAARAATSPRLVRSK